MKKTNTPSTVPLIGILTEEVTVDDKGQGRTKNGDPARIMTAGVRTIPGRGEEAQRHVEYIAQAAFDAGHEMPRGGLFTAGQVFYKDGQVEEVRLESVFPGEEKRHVKVWTTPTPPQIGYQDGQLLWNPDDEGRPHFSAVVERNPSAPDGFNLWLSFDLRDNAQIVPPTKPAQKPFLIDESLAMLPNGKADRDFQAGLLRLPDFWGRNEERVTRYFNGSEGHVIEYQPSEVVRALGDAPERALDALDRRFSEIKSEAVADVIDILFHHWATHKDPTTNSAIISAAKLCEYRNKTTSGENLDLHWHALRDAFSFTLRDSKGDLKAQLFFSESKGENSDGPGARYVYSPGFMLQYALQGQPLYFAPFLQKVWALDPVRHNEAKRLARYLRADWRMNTQAYLTAESGGPRAARWHSWTFLLAEAGINVETHRNSKNPKRLIEAMARAVETLYQMEVVAEGGFSIYHPTDRKKAENLPTRGALDVWLALRVCLAPSASLREALLTTDGKRRAGRARDAKALATERAKKQLRATSKGKHEQGKS